MKQKMKSDEELQKRMEVGLRIRRERLLWDMTQEELSEVLGISANYLGQIERGNRELSRNMEERLCQLFRLTHNDLHMTAGEHGWPPRMSEAGVIFNDLSEEDISRLLHSCSPGELQLCGHIIRSLLLYMRNPSSPRAVLPRLTPVPKTGEENRLTEEAGAPNKRGRKRIQSVQT